MKRVAVLATEGGKVFGIIHGPDASRQSIKVGGRIWRFDHDDYGGPLWLKADFHTPRKNQCPTNQKVWDAYQRWLRKFEKNRSTSNPARNPIEGVPLKSPQIGFALTNS